VSANEPVAPDRSASGRIRAHLGERLRAFYDCLQQMPASERIGVLLTRLKEGEDEALSNGDESTPPSASD
jgi:hypothetical protein